MGASIAYIFGAVMSGLIYYKFFTVCFERKPMSLADRQLQKVADSIFLTLAVVLWPLSLPVFFLFTLPFFIIRKFR
jgi:hypothetical protein